MWTWGSLSPPPVVATAYSPPHANTEGSAVARREQGGATKKVHSVSRGWSAVQHMMNCASHVCATNTNYGDLNLKGKNYGRRAALAASPSLELAQAHRGAKVPHNGWEGGTYNNNNDRNVPVLCTVPCETEGI